MDRESHGVKDDRYDPNQGPEPTAEPSSTSGTSSSTETPPIAHDASDAALFLAALREAASTLSAELEKVLAAAKPLADSFAEEVEAIFGSPIYPSHTDLKPDDSSQTTDESEPRGPLDELSDMEPE